MWLNMASIEDVFRILLVIVNVAVMHYVLQLCCVTLTELRIKFTFIDFVLFYTVSR